LKLKNAGVLFEITNTCNLNCRHCYKPNFGGKDLTLEQIRTILMKLAGFGVHYMLLTGGEPLLRKDLFQIIDSAIHYDFEEIIINTNGLLLNDSKVVDEIRDRINVISCLPLSFDGARSETHDWIRGKGQFDKLMSILETNAVQNLPIDVNVTIGQWNFEDLEHFFVLYERLNANAINFGIFIPLGKGSNMKDQVLTIKQCETLIQFAKMKKNQGYEVELCSLPYANIYDPDLSGNCCHIFTEFITVTARGNIIPCILYDYDLGSPLKMELKEIFSNPLVNIFRKPKKLQKKMNGYCNTCSQFEICKGGCKVLTNALTGCIFNSDPLCPFQKRS